LKELSEVYQAASGKVAELKRQKEVFNKAMAEYYSTLDAWVDSELIDAKNAREIFASLNFKVTMEIQQFKEALPMSVTTSTHHLMQKLS
jgi:hypothetical protein